MRVGKHGGAEGAPLTAFYVPCTWRELRCWFLSHQREAAAGRLPTVHAGHRGKMLLRAIKGHLSASRGVIFTAGCWSR